MIPKCFKDKAKDWNCERELSYEDVLHLLFCHTLSCVCSFWPLSFDITPTLLLWIFSHVCSKHPPPDFGPTFITQSNLFTSSNWGQNTVQRNWPFQMEIWLWTPYLLRTHMSSPLFFATYTTAGFTLPIKESKILVIQFIHFDLQWFTQQVNLFINLSIF